MNPATTGKFNNGLPLNQKQIDDIRAKAHITPISSGASAAPVADPETRIAQLKSGTYGKTEQTDDATANTEEKGNNNSSAQDLFGKSKVAKVLNNLSTSEQATGNDLTAGARAGMAEKNSLAMTNSQIDTEITLMKLIRQQKAEGKDTTHAEQTLAGVRANSIADNGDISKDVPEVNKTTEQALGDVLGTGVDALAAGGLGATAYTGAKGATDAMAKDKGVGGVLRAGTIGALAGKILEVGFNKASPLISDALSKYGQPLYEKIAQYIPESAKAGMKALADAAHTVADKVTIGEGKGGTEALEKINNTIDKPLNKLAEKSNTARENKITNARKGLENNYNDIFKQTKSSTKQLLRSTDAGKNPSKLLADKGYILDLDGTKLNTAPTVEKLHSDAEELNQIMDQAVQEKASDPNVKPISLADLEQNAVNSVDNPQTRRMGLVKDMQNKVKQEFANYRDIYGESVNIKDANEIKKGQWEKTKYFNPQDAGYVKDVNNQIGHVFKDAVEKGFGDDFPVQRLNQYIGDHYDAINLLDKINGNTIKGGRLGNYLTKAVGTTLGASVGGPFGAVAGYMGGDLLNDLMTRSAIADPLKRYILEHYADKLSPSVVKEATAKLGTIKKPLLGLPESSGGAKVQMNQPIHVAPAGRTIESTGKEAMGGSYKPTKAPKTLKSKKDIAKAQQKIQDLINSLPEDERPDIEF